MKIPPKTLTVYDPIFKQKIIVFINRTKKEFDAWQKKMNVANDMPWNYNLGAFTTHLSAEEAPDIYVVYVPKFDWTIDDQATLIHELIHVITRVWNSNNIVFNNDTQEFFAHSVDKLWSNIAWKLMPRKKK